MDNPPAVLTIAGSDPSGGAGLQADLKTFCALGAYGCAIPVALTAQNTTTVSAVYPIPAHFIAQQIDTLLEDVALDAVKIGMLSNAEIVHLVGGYLKGSLSGVYKVLDPVMVSTSGSRLLDHDAVQAMKEILPYADLITPNLGEAAVLLDCEPAQTVAQMREQAQALRNLGAQRVLLKGGHLSGDACDILSGPEGDVDLASFRVNTQNTHGTGCTLSSALAALRPRAGSWAEAAQIAKGWLTGALQHADELHIGHGHGPVHHFWSGCHWDSTE